MPVFVTLIFLILGAILQASVPDSDHYWITTGLLWGFIALLISVFR